MFPVPVIHPADHVILRVRDVDVARGIHVEALRLVEFRPVGPAAVPGIAGRPRTCHSVDGPLKTGPPDNSNAVILRVRDIDICASHEHVLRLVESRPSPPGRRPRNTRRIRSPQRSQMNPRPGSAPFGSRCSPCPRCRCCPTRRPTPLAACSSPGQGGQPAVSQIAVRSVTRHRIDHPGRLIHLPDPAVVRVGNEQVAGGVPPARHSGLSSFVVVARAPSPV